MILVPGTSLQIVLAGAVAANQLEVHVDYVDWNPQGVKTPPAPYRVATNNTTDVVILAAPVANPVREPIEVNVYNKDTASATVIIKTDDGTTEFIIERRTLTTLQTLNWKTNTTWTVIATS
jgi:hypothetical protein